MPLKRDTDCDDIISKKSLEVVKEVVLLLKQHSRQEGLFRHSGRRIVRQHILDSLKKGDKLQISNTPDAAKECAAALQIYLMQMKVPVIPRRVQQLLLADNPGITAQTVAHDALGLICQDVNGRHSELLIYILGLLKHLLIFPPPTERSELKASSLVISFLPVFFDMTSDDITKWRQVAARLNELIIEAPEQLLRKRNILNPQNSRQTTVNNSIVVSNDNNQMARFRELSLLYPLIRLIEDRDTYHIGENLRAYNHPARRPLVGRLHPAIIRTRT